MKMVALVVQKAPCHAILMGAIIYLKPVMVSQIAGTTQMKQIVVSFSNVLSGDLYQTNNMK